MIEKTERRGERVVCSAFHSSSFFLLTTMVFGRHITKRERREGEKTQMEA